MEIIFPERKTVQQLWGEGSKEKDKVEAMFTLSHVSNTGWPGATLEAVLYKSLINLRKPRASACRGPVSSLQRIPRQRRPGAHSPENEKVMSAEADVVALASEQSKKGRSLQTRTSD